MKFRITIDGKTYDAEVEILETEESGPLVQSYAPDTTPYVAVAGTNSPAQTNGNDSDASDKVCRSPVTGLVIKVNVEPGQGFSPTICSWCSRP